MRTFINGRNFVIPHEPNTLICTYPSSPQTNGNATTVTAKNSTTAITTMTTTESNNKSDFVIRLNWTNLSYTITRTSWCIKDGYKISRTTDEKVILKPQSGELRGGTITALMGPSGAGKLFTTFDIPDK